MGMDGKASVPGATVLKTSGLVYPQPVMTDGIEKVEDALADGIDDAETELRNQLADLKTPDGLPLTEACPEVREILDEYTRTLEQAKAEAGLKGHSKDRASRVASREYDGVQSDSQKFCLNQQ